MSVPQHVPDPLGLPEAELLQDQDRLREYSDAFLRGDIDAKRYTELTVAELNRRLPIDPAVAVAESDAVSIPVPAEQAPLRVVQPVILPGDTAPRF